MRHLIFFFTFIFLLPLTLCGQKGNFKSFSINHPIDSILLNPNKHSLKVQRKNNFLFDLEKKNFILSNPHQRKIRDPRDLIFPGASKYYGRGSNLSVFPYRESFAIKPDSTFKYYLIVINPFDSLLKK